MTTATSELTRIKVQEKEYIVEQRNNRLIIETEKGVGITVVIGPSGIFRIESTSAMDIHLEASNSLNIGHR